MAEEKKDPIKEEDITVEPSGAKEEEVPDTQTIETQEDSGGEAASGSDKAGDEQEDTKEYQEENPAETDGEESPEDEDKKGKTEKGSWGFGFGKNKKEDKKDQQIAELNDKVKRQLAEFDNYRKRTEKEKSAMFEIGAKSVLEKLLPIIDNFERGLAAIPETEKENATAVGMDKIYKQLLKALEELEVKPIEAMGQQFSPDFHNAVMQVEVEGVEENTIVEEFQKGYLYRDSVLRYSMVKVNR
ncbi:MAG: nucleotide exchange factor GrpE [Lachnospiraceae bacterium]|jgi:molecular chaperone GrpE|nr:nucleotide exchange factor GrpE [Lachnospiraceae bacterium]